jgi:hypothetical protein
MKLLTVLALSTVMVSLTACGPHQLTQSDPGYWEATHQQFCTGYPLNDKCQPGYVIPAGSTQAQINNPFTDSAPPASVGSFKMPTSVAVPNMGVRH